MASPSYPWCLIFGFFMLSAVSTTISKTTSSAEVSQVPSSKDKCHNIYTSNFYAGPNKNVEALLREIKKELGDMREEIRILKENKTTGNGPNKKVEALLHEIKKELGDMREEIMCLKENKTTGKVYKNCAELYNDGKRLSGVYTIDPDNGGAFDVFCDQTTAGGGWTVFQKRLDGSVDFYRGWDDYKRGFGNLSGEFWLGLDKINRLTKDKSRLRVELQDTSGNTAYAEYSFFGVASEISKYKLSLGTYSGTAGDSLSYSRGSAFSTKDRDNDKDSGSCATRWKSGWWFNACHYANLNGLYYHGQHSNSWGGVMWYKWKGEKYSAKRAEMKIKPVII